MGGVEEPGAGVDEVADGGGDGAEELDFFTAGKVAGAAGADEDDAEMEEDDEDGLGEMDEEEYYGEMERRKRMKRKAAAAAKNAPAPGMAAAPAAQPPFQVGAVPASGGKNDGDAASGVSRRFLCYNMMGTVITTGEAGSDFNSVEMAFHDTSRAGRVPTITDYHGYDIGVLGERGCALASPGKSEGGAATVFYRPYESWAHTSEWRVTLPAGERATSPPPRAPRGSPRSPRPACSASSPTRARSDRWCSSRAPP